MALPLIAVVALLALWSGYWFVAMHFARLKAAEERAKLAAQGVNLVCDSENWGGYPFRFEFSCTQPRLTLGDGTRAAASRLEALAQAYMPWHVMLLLDGPTALTPRGQPSLEARHGRAVASINLRSPNEPVVIAETRNLEVKGLGTAQHALLSYRQRGGGTREDAAVDASVVTVTLPGRPPVSFDRITADATAEARQSFTLRSAQATSGTLTLQATGAATLDAERRPQGQVEASLNDPAAAAKLIAAIAGLTAEQQNAVTTALALFGGKATLTARDGVLSLGPLPIAKLQPLD